MPYSWNITVATAVCCEQDEFGWYGVQCDSFAEKGSALDSCYQPSYGFAARPVDATFDAEGNVDEGCQVIKAGSGRTKALAWLGHDTRYSDKCPPLTKGSCAQWNAKGAFSLLDYDADTWTLYVPRVNGTKAHTVVVGQDSNGKAYIELRHQLGSYLALTEDSAVLRHTGSALIEVLSDAINLNGKVNTTASFTVGGVAAQPLTNNTALLLYLEALEALIAAFAVIIDTKLPPPVPPGVAASVPAGAFKGAAAALKLALSTQMIKGI